MTEKKFAVVQGRTSPCRAMTVEDPSRVVICTSQDSAYTLCHMLEAKMRRMQDKAEGDLEHEYAFEVVEVVTEESMLQAMSEAFE